MLKKIEHIGIAVKDLKTSNELFKTLLGVPHYKTEHVASEGVTTSFFDVGTHKVELLEATNPNSPIAKFIAKKGEGVHHIAFEVDDIQSEINRLEVEGFHMIYNPARSGADNKLVTFIHPKGTDGILVELCQEIHNSE